MSTLSQTQREARIGHITGLYTGPTATDTAGLEAYTEPNALYRIVGASRRRAMAANRRQLEANYRGAVESQLRNRIVLLCPQTAALLYAPGSVRRPTYSRGSRPELENAAAAATEGAATEGAASDRERVLGIMRFCRDLYKKAGDRQLHDAAYVYGGTEEQLIEHGEETCECLSRLFVALCEVIGIPARIIHHVIGGHITAEAWIDDGWAYVDPRMGLRLRRPDGGLASLWEAWTTPGLTADQPAAVRNDVSERSTWEQRVTRCREAFFRPEEIQGVVSYSLSENDRYDYRQTTTDAGARAGLWGIHADYTAATAAAFGTPRRSEGPDWARTVLKKVPLVYRNDGFTPFFVEQQPMTPKSLANRFIDPLADTNVETIEWSVGPGSVLCYDSRADQILGDGLTAKQLNLLREGDRRAIDNVHHLIAAGHDPLRVVTTRAQELALRAWIRLEMNHEYGPPREDNWKWVGLVGRFAKAHPEYRIPGGVFLDFAHEEVRKHKLAVIGEMLEREPDAVSLDFCVYPPFFENPDAAVMTDFIRTIRRLANEAGESAGRRIDLVVRVPVDQAEELGLDWRTWIDEELIDLIVVSLWRQSGRFDVPIDEVVRAAQGTNCRVYGCLWQALGFVDTDERPEDDETGRKRYDKPKTREMFRAQAMMFHRAGVDGLQLAMAADEWTRKPWMNELADPAAIRFAGKTYMVDQHRHLPLRFSPQEAGADVGIRTEAGRGTSAAAAGTDNAGATPHTAADVGTNAGTAETDTAGAAPHTAAAAGTNAPANARTAARTAAVVRCVSMRIADNIQAVTEAGRRARAELILYCRDLGLTELLEVFVNGRGPVTVPRAAHVDAPEAQPPDEDAVFDETWWRRGERTISFEADWLALGTNSLRFRYSAGPDAPPEELCVRWVDVSVRYDSAVSTWGLNGTHTYAEDTTGANESRRRVCMLKRSGRLYPVSELELVRFNLRFGSVSVPAEGFAGVHTLPEHRGEGNINRLMSSTMEQMRTRVNVAFLYGIEKLYGKFGFVSCLPESHISVWVGRTRQGPLPEHYSIREDDAADAAYAMSMFNSAHALRPWTAVRDGDDADRLMGRHKWRPRPVLAAVRRRGHMVAYAVMPGSLYGNTPRDLTVLEAVAVDAEAGAVLLNYIGGRCRAMSIDEFSIAEPSDSVIGRCAQAIGCVETIQTRADGGGMASILNRSALVESLEDELLRRVRTAHSRLGIQQTNAVRRAREVVREIAAGALIPHETDLVRLLLGTMRFEDADGTPILSAMFPGPSAPWLPAPYSHKLDRY